MAVLVATLAAGCSDPDGEQPLPTEPPTSADPTPTVEVETSPLATPSPGPTPWPEPTRPEAMERDDIEGAKAAAEYFMALYPYVYATGDLVEWQAMSHPECQFCRGAEEYVAALYSDGGYARGGKFTVREVEVVPPNDEFAHYQVFVEASEEPSTSYAADGEVLRSLRGGDVEYALGVLREGSDWIIRGVASLEEP